MQTFGSEPCFLGQELVFSPSPRNPVDLGKSFQNVNVQSWQEAFVASNVLGKEKDFFFLVDDAKPSCDFSETFLFFFFFCCVLSNCSQPVGCWLQLLTATTFSCTIPQPGSVSSEMGLLSSVTGTVLGTDLLLNALCDFLLQLVPI